MRSFIISLIIAGIVVASSLFFVGEIEKVSKSVGESVEEIVEALDAEDFEKAGALTEEMAEYVDREKITLAVIMDHTQLDKIESEIAELEGYIKGRVKNDALAKCNVIDVQVRHMPKNYKLKIENIL